MRLIEEAGKSIRPEEYDRLTKALGQVPHDVFDKLNKQRPPPDVRDKLKKGYDDALDKLKNELDRPPLDIGQR